MPLYVYVTASLSWQGTVFQQNRDRGHGDYNGDRPSVGSPRLLIALCQYNLLRAPGLPFCLPSSLTGRRGVYTLSLSSHHIYEGFEEESIGSSPLKGNYCLQYMEDIFCTRPDGPTGLMYFSATWNPGISVLISAWNLKGMTSVVLDALVKGHRSTPFTENLATQHIREGNLSPPICS